MRSLNACAEHETLAKPAAASRGGVLLACLVFCSYALISVSKADAQGRSARPPKDAHHGPKGPGPSKAQAPTLEGIFEAFRHMPGLEARFEERKYLAMLKTPLQSRGRLYFFPPSTLLRRNEGPNAEEIVIDPSQVRRRYAGKEEILSLKARPEIRPLVESMLWIFTGNLKALRETYHLDFRASAEAGEGWTLSLTPRSSPLDRLIATMTIRGKGESVEEIEVRERRGDRSVTRIEQADPRRSFSEEEKTRLLGSSPPKAKVPRTKPSTDG